MRTHTLNRLSAGVLSGALVCALSATAGHVRAQAAGVEAQIHGQVEGTVTAAPISSSALSFRVDVAATGILSHIGRIEATWAVPEVMLDLVNLNLIVANPQWNGTLTAANGDQIFGEYAFRDDTIPLSPTGNLSFEVDLQITGGTGRFKYASGQAVAVGTANIFSGAFTIDLSGRFLRGKGR